ncbi:Hypothetical protein AA314_06177 [Archangium gephyra]|uniref:Uncharacterized protein n=1 Tax=Archangium gephyra TaxID=48 RepID=A0AAC8QCG4_9BACT|nr:Hypothetical protein AA314_06177 [Archangium gephyra]
MNDTIRVGQGSLLGWKQRAPQEQGVCRAEDTPEDEAVPRGARESSARGAAGANRPASPTNRTVTPRVGYSASPSSRSDG